MSNELEDCLQCRLVSGVGLLGASVYVVQQSKNVKTSSQYVIKAVGCALGIIGILRIFALPPFRSHASEEG